MKNLKKKTLVILFCLSINFDVFANSENLNKAQKLYDNKEYWQSIELLNIVVKEEPKNPEPHLLLSKCYESLFELDKSFKELEIFNSLKNESKKNTELVKIPEPSKTPEISNSEEQNIQSVDIIIPKKITPTEAPIVKNDEVNIQEQNNNNQNNEKLNEYPKISEDEKGVKIIEINPSEYINSIAISKDNKYIASGAGRAYHGDMKIWDIETGNLIKEFTPHEKSIISMDFSPNSKNLAFSSLDGDLVIMDTKDWKITKTIKNKKGAKSVVFSPDGNSIAADGFSKAQIWSLKTGQNISNIKDTHPLVFQRFNYNGSILATANGYGNGERSKEINIWDVSSGKKNVTLSNSNPSQCFSFHPQGKFIAVGNGNNITVWNISGQEIKLVKGKTKYSITSIDYSPDGKYLVTGIYALSGSSWLTIYNTKTYQILKELEITSGGVEEIHFSKNGRYIVSRGYGNIMRIIDINKYLY